MRWRTVAVAVAVTGLLVTACGDDSDDEADDSGEDSSAETENGEAGGGNEAETGDGEDDTDGGDHGENAASGSGGFCEDLVNYVQEYNEVLTTAFEGSSPPEDISTDTFEDLGEAVRSVAPAEIADDMEMTSRQMELMVAGMTGDASANDELMADPEAFQAASTSVQDYAMSTCGFDPEAYIDDQPIAIE